MAWGAAATGTPAATGSTGQGLSLMQESLAEITLARLPLVVLNMARAQGDYFQATRGGGHGDYRHLVLAPADVGRGGRAGPAGLRPRRAVAQPGARDGRLLPGPHRPVGRPSRRAASTRRRPRLGPRRVDRRDRARPSWSRSSAPSSSATTSATTSPSTTRPVPRPPPSMVAARRAAGRGGGHRRRRGGGGGLRHPGDATCAPRSAQLRAEGCAVGFVRPITLFPFPAEAVAGAAPGAHGRSPSTRTTRARWSTTSAWPCSGAPRSTSSAA